MTRESAGGSEQGMNTPRRRWRPTMLTAIIVLAAQSSCGLVMSEPDTSRVGGASTGGTGGRLPALGGTTSGGGLGFAGGVGVGGSGGAECVAPDVTNLFADQETALTVGAPRIFYSWTTDVQVAELRAGGPLFSRSESPGQGRGLALTQLAAYGAAGTTPEQKLAQQLDTTVFAKVRFSWTNPWATLLGWPGENYGNQLLEIELKPEAWIAIFDGNSLYVVDAQNQAVAVDTALASPERIGAIYYVAQADGKTSQCGSFALSAVAFREFVLGNIQMVAKWSLATPEIADRLTSDIGKLQTFEAGLACIPAPDPGEWVNEVTCDWHGDGRSPLSSYDRALSIPSALYLPTRDNITALIAALRTSMPTGDPLVVTPNG